MFTGLTLTLQVSCQYRAACRFNDDIEVYLKVREVRSKTITYEFQVMKNGEEAAEGLVKCIATTLKWKVVDLPEDFAKAIRNSAM